MKNYLTRYLLKTKDRKSIEELKRTETGYLGKKICYNFEDSANDY